MSVCIHACVHVCVFCTQTHTHTHVNTHTHTDTHTHTHTHVYIYNVYCACALLVFVCVRARRHVGCMHHIKAIACFCLVVCCLSLPPPLMGALVLLCSCAGDLVLSVFTCGQMHPEGAPPPHPLYHYFRSAQIGSMVLTQVGAKVAWGQVGWGWGHRGRRRQWGRKGRQRQCGEKRLTVIFPVMILLLPLVQVCICMWVPVVPVCKCMRGYWW